MNKFIDTCCLGCTRLEYNKIDDIKNTIIQKNTNSTLYDLYMPIKNSPSATTFMTYSYVEILRLENSIFYTKPFSPQPDRLIHILVKGTFKTWPLFGTAIVMAICAGTLIWLMVSNSSTAIKTLYYISSFCKQRQHDKKKKKNNGGEFIDINSPPYLVQMLLI